MMPREMLEAIWKQAGELCPAAGRRSSATRSSPALTAEGIELVRWADLDRDEQRACKRLFKERIFPVLTPLAVDPAHPFPYISGLSLNLAVDRSATRAPTSSTSPG